jgi:hypothetical protein
VTAPADAKEVLCALRLGWYLAEVRGRNKPGGPLGAMASMHDHTDHALPLRIERSGTELRIEAQKVVAQLAEDLCVDASGDVPSFGAAIDDKAKLLDPIRAPKVSAALQRALQELQLAAAGLAYPGKSEPPAPERTLHTLRAAVNPQRDVVASHVKALAAAEQALAAAQRRAAGAAQQPDGARSAAQADQAEATVGREQAATAGEQRGVAELQQAITGLQQALDVNPANPETAVKAGARQVRARLQIVVGAAHRPWEDFAGLLWRFDAHIQDRLSATSETQACGYQLGRGLAETYWALDPSSQDGGSASWRFLLSEHRCAELSRLVGRLAAYMDDYTAPAIAASLEVWRQVAAKPAWRSADPVAEQALYRQTRRWYELIILRQDPTTLIRPSSVIKNYRTLGRVIRLFWPQLVATIIGLAFLITFLVLLGIDSGTAWEKTLSAILAAAGLSLGGLTGILKNSAQAMLKRLRQDTYTDLIANAVQTAPTPPNKSDLRKAISNRQLTPATPN